MFNSKVLFIVLVCGQICLSAKYLKQQPSWLDGCDVEDKNLNKCAHKSTISLFQQLFTGIPDLGILPLDPMKIDKIALDGGDGPVNIDISMKNITVFGLSQMNITRYKLDIAQKNTTMQIFIPSMKIVGLYKINGRILILPINGEGDCFIEPRNIIANVKSGFNWVTKKNFHFHNITFVNIDYNFGDLKLRFNNLFNGNKELGDGTNDYLNKNWEAASEAFKPILQATIEGLFIRIMRKLSESVPGDFFFKNYSFN